VVTEQAGSTTRTSTAGYDPAGRPTTQSLVVSPAADGGTPVPDVTTSYDPVTGLATTLTAGTDTLVTGYDSLGRVNAYTDADHQASTVTYDIDGRPATATDGKGTQTYTYDGVIGEHRGLLTKLSDSQAGDFTASYDAAGAMTTEVFPGGLTSRITHDNTGTATSLTYTNAGATWLSFTQTHDVGGQVRTQAGPDGSEIFSYDNAGRLTAVDDHYSPGGTNTSCTRRSYGFDANSNRLSATTRPGSLGSTGCDYTSGTDTTTSHTYDTADRITDTGYAYDNLGRTTTTPAAAVAGGADLSLGYYADDMVASQAQAGHTLSFTLDPGRRLRAQTDSVTGVTETNHYDGTGDSPSWIAKSDGTWQRFASAIGGDLAAQIDSTGAVTLQLTNLHGDVVATCDTGTTGVAGYHEQTEFGVPRDPTQVGIRYAWLGANQRSGDDLGGLILMGVRLYDPTTGRFLQPDPVPGGSANDYDYADQDPINNRDLDGRMVTDVDECGVSCMRKVVTRMKATATATLRKLTKRVGGGTSFRKVVNRGWHVVRFAKNAPLTLAGYGLAEAAGGHCSLQKGLMVYCSGMPKPLALSGGWTLGNTYMSHRRYSDQLRERLRHESKHSDQYVIFGGASWLVLYGGDAVIHKGNQGKMWFERWAGLKDGHYR
jgi:RHS repeat-associated protein